MEGNPVRKIRIMGIVNLTDDSFFAGSRFLGKDGSFDPGLFLSRVASMRSEGADIIDLGACSTRPGSESVSEEEEWLRLKPALDLLAREDPGVDISVDTFRPGIVTRAFDTIGPFIVNDVSGGSDAMWKLVGGKGLTYVAMHTRGTPKDMQDLTDYDDVVSSVKSFFDGISETADAFGVKDWILDPGFGFGKTVEQNFGVFHSLEILQEAGRPVLVGISRKRMVWMPLGLTPDTAGEATQRLHLEALERGADILRVHDVPETLETLARYRQEALHPGEQE